MAIAVLGIGILNIDQGIASAGLVVSLEILANGSILVGDVLLEKGTQGLANEVEGHLDETLGGDFFLTLAASLAVVSRWRLLRQGLVGGSGIGGSDRSRIKSRNGGGDRRRG